MGKCVYCKAELSNESVVEICDQCGIKSYGSKMFKAIVENMKQAQVRGDLDQDVAI